jgi:hypothetical protein
MGLLDDAIREHLELKRLRGADPGEVIREEHEALGPVVYGGEHAPEETDAEWDAEDDDSDPEVTSDATSEGAGATDNDPFDQLLPDHDDEDAGQDEDEPRPAAGEPVPHLTVEQETAEVDMQAMLDSDSGDEDPDALEFDDDQELGWDEPSARDQRD